MAIMRNTPCNSELRGDFAHEECNKFCSVESARSHCRWCKCRSCSFCKAAKIQGSEKNATKVRWRVNAEWCEVMLRRPTHRLRRMWATEPYAHLQFDKPACWERERDRPHKRQAPASFFANALNGTYCRTNWYEGHPAPLGSPGNVPAFRRQAPALLGTDEGIYNYCRARLPPEQAGSARFRLGSPGHVAKACVAADLNILNMVGYRVRWNTCRNLEWQLCAIFGRLPGQNGLLTIHLADAPRELDVSPWSRAAPTGCDSSSRYALKDVYTLELCMFHRLCTNGKDIFKLDVGQPFVCRFSRERFDQLQALLLGERGGC